MSLRKNKKNNEFLFRSRNWSFLRLSYCQQLEFPFVFSFITAADRKKDGRNEMSGDIIFRFQSSSSPLISFITSSSPKKG